MNVSAASSALPAEISMSLQRKSLDMKIDQNAQLLQSLPKAAGPAHLGQGVDLYA